MKPIVPIHHLFVVLALLLAPSLAFGAALTVEVRDSSGNRVGSAVVSARSTRGHSASIPGTPGEMIMDQKNRRFVPRVLAVRVGTPVRFPNSDDIRHHVYSFSPAKTFELPLYKGTPSNPVVFDRPGIATLGCNIHDSMVGYVYVADTPHFAVTSESGVAALTNLPAGSYDVTVWGPSLVAAESELTRRVEFGTGSMTVTFVVKQIPEEHEHGGEPTPADKFKRFRDGNR